MAFLPQFVPAGRDPVRGVALLAAVYLAMGWIWLLVWMSSVRRLSGLVRSATVTRIAEGALCAVFCFFAVRLILSA